jgi:hypothetical protein
MFSWQARDPLKDAEKKQGMNLYKYTADNPLSSIDGFGLELEKKVGDPGDLAGLAMDGLLWASRSKAIDEGEKQCGSRQGGIHCPKCCVISIIKKETAEQNGYFVFNSAYLANESCSQVASKNNPTIPTIKAPGSETILLDY